MAGWERVEAGSDGAGGRKGTAVACYPPLGVEEMDSRSSAKIKNAARAAPKIIVGRRASVPLYLYNYASKYEPLLLLRRETIVEYS